MSDTLEIKSCNETSRVVKLRLKADVSQLLKGTIEKVAKEASLCPEEDQKGMCIIVRQLGKQLDSIGLEDFLSDDDALTICDQVWLNVRESNVYRQQIQPNEATLCDLFPEVKKLLLYEIVDQLKKRGMKFPNVLPSTTTKHHLLLNKEMNVEKDAALVKAAYILLYFPRQLDLNFQQNNKAQ